MSTLLAPEPLVQTSHDDGRPQVALSPKTKEKMLSSALQALGNLAYEPGTDIGHPLVRQGYPKSIGGHADAIVTGGTEELAEKSDRVATRWPGDFVE